VGGILGFAGSVARAQSSTSGATAEPFVLRIAEARIEQQPGVYDRGLLYLRVEGRGRTPLGLRPTVQVQGTSVHVGPLSPGDVPGSFVARVDWDPSARALVGTLHAEGASAELGPLVFDAPPPPRRGPPPDTLLIGAAVGSAVIDGRLAARGLRGQADIVYPFRLGGSAVLASGIELGYERYWSVDVSGLRPGMRTLATSSGLGVGVPVVLRFGASDAAWTPYVGLVFGLHLQNTRFVIETGDLVDKDAAVWMLAGKFGLERATGPGAIFAEVAFRNGGDDPPTSIPVKGGALMLGYRLHL
jgi:hypothetical protein